MRKYERLACHPSFGVTFGYQTLVRTTRGGRRRRRSRWCLHWHTFHHTPGAPTSTGFSHVVTRAGSSPRAFEIRFLSLIGFLESCDEDKLILCTPWPENVRDLSFFVDDFSFFPKRFSTNKFLSESCCNNEIFSNDVIIQNIFDIRCLVADNHGIIEYMRNRNALNFEYSDSFDINYNNEIN